MRRTLFIFWLCASLLPTCLAQQFTVSGRLTCARHGYRSTEEDPPLVEGQFTLSVSNCLWIIRSHQNDDISDYEEVSTDGHDTYSLTSVREMIKAKKSAGLRVGTNPLIGQILPGTAPDPTRPVNRILWWLYCSNCHLDALWSKSVTDIEPIFYVDSAYAMALAVQNIRLPAHLERETQFPGLPSVIVNVDDGVARFWPSPSGAAFVAPMQKRLRPAPFDKGFTNVVLRVSAWRSVGGMRLPETASVEWFWDTLNADHAVRLRESFDLTATNFQESAEAQSFMPKLDAEVAIADLRFIADQPPVFGFNYRVTNNSWPSTAMVKTFGEYQSKLATRQFDTKVAIEDGKKPLGRITTGLTVFVIIFGCSTAFIIFFLGREGNSKKHKWRK
jgi:hypothetical protein